MITETNIVSLAFSDVVRNFIKKPKAFPDGSEKRVSGIYVHRKDGVIMARNNKNKVILVIKPMPDNVLEVKMAFTNGTVFRRLLAVKDLLKWDDINLEHSGGLAYLITNSGKRTSLLSPKLYSYSELQAMTNDE